MSDATQNQIRAHISTTSKPGYTPAKHVSGSTNYYYMFTGGYTYDAGRGTVGQHTSSPDQGPAGEVEFTEAASQFTISVVNDDGTDFKIKQWNLSSDGTLTGERFNPEPNADLPSPYPEVLSINVSQVPSGHHGEYKGYFVTLANSTGDVIKLDPRIYDMRD